MATFAPLLGIASVVVALYAWVKPTNFAGFDEWVILSLVERGITDIPYANRPLSLVPSLPTRLGPASLWTYHVLHTAYFVGIGCLVFRLCQRLAPAESTVAFLAAIFAVTWAPLDYQRLNIVQPYAGLTFCACLGLVLFLESWLRRSNPLFFAGMLVAFVSIRAYEGGGALLAGAPLLLLWVKRPPPRAWTWVVAWEAVVCLALVLTALPLLLPSRRDAYQAQVLGVDLDALHVLRRLIDQFEYHLATLVTIPLAEFRCAAVPTAVVVFVAAFWIVARERRIEWEPRASRRRELAGLVAAGLLLASLGYAVLILSGGLVRGARTQFFSAPGIGLFLASTFALAASMLPRVCRLPAIGLLATWVVAAGAARTNTLQGFWDQGSVYTKQARMLGQLVQIAPHLKPNTFVLLIDEAKVFEVSHGFRHALLYLYPGEVTGHAWEQVAFLYRIQVTPAGVLSEPWPVLREPWRTPVTLYPYEQLLVVKQTAGAPLVLLDGWPSVLPPLPAGARYNPRALILEGPPPRTRRILELSRPPA